MIGDARSVPRKIRLQIHVVESGRTDQAVDGGGAVAAGIGAGEEICPSARRVALQLRPILRTWIGPTGSDFHFRF